MTNDCCGVWSDSGVWLSGFIFKVVFRLQSFNKSISDVFYFEGVLCLCLLSVHLFFFLRSMLSHNHGHASPGEEFEISEHTVYCTQTSCRWVKCNCGKKALRRHPQNIHSNSKKPLVNSSKTKSESERFQLQIVSSVFCWQVLRSYLMPAHVVKF